MKPLGDLRDAMKEAKLAWQGCEWITEFGPQRMNLCGLRSRQASLAAKATRGEESKCWKEAALWLETVERDAARAAELAEFAIQAAQQNEFQKMQRLLMDAIALEQKYRIAIVYTDVKRVCDQWMRGHEACP